MSSDCPAADLAKRISDIHRGRYLAVHIVNTEPDRAPLVVNIPSRTRIPDTDWLGYLVGAALLVVLLSTLLGCGGRGPSSAPPPGQARVPAAASLPDQVGAVGDRLVSDAVMVRRWKDYRSTVNAIGRRP